MQFFIILKHLVIKVKDLLNPKNPNKRLKVAINWINGMQKIRQSLYIFLTIANSQSSRGGSFALRLIWFHTGYMNRIIIVYIIIIITIIQWWRDVTREARYQGLHLFKLIDSCPYHHKMVDILVIHVWIKVCFADISVSRLERVK